MSEPKPLTRYMREVLYYLAQYDGELLPPGIGIAMLNTARTLRERGLLVLENDTVKITDAGRKILEI